ncbi:class I SAM-dependent methyltransferase [Candidatus Roizmanbacteria bacterium]|nr:class I SAM-dependent methyltransferase [Candidatus Roizmanbacteria bacterium]
MKTYWQKIKDIVGPAEISDFDKIGQKETRTCFEKFITQHSKKTTLLLDAGCNTGVEAVRLYKAGFKGKYFGVDSNSKAVKFAKKNLKGNTNCQFFIEDLSKLNFKKDTFDIILIKDVLEHEQYYVKILTELARVTKKYLILSMFIKPSFFLGDKIKLHPDGYYLNRYNQGKLFRFMAKHHFKKPTKIFEDWQDVVLVFEKML